MKAFTFDEEATRQFIALGYDLYRDDPSWVPPLRSDIEAQLSPRFPFYRRPGSDHRRFLALRGRRPMARVVATVHAALRDREGAPLGAVGFFDAVEDYEAAEEVLAAAVEWLRAEHGVRRVQGPMNFDIWHGYRFMTAGFERERFFGEPYNKRYYPAFFERFGFRACRRWNSFELPGALPAAALAPKASVPDAVAALGYRCEPFGRRPFGEGVALLHDVLTRSFASFPGYTPIGLDEFRGLMTLARHVLHPRCSTFVFDDAGALVGFTAVFVDVADAVRGLEGGASPAGRVRFWWRRRRARRLLLHLGGITPAEAARHSGIAAAAFRHTLDKMRAEGCESVFATLIARGNPARRLFGPSAADTRREYVLYEARA